MRTPFQKIHLAAYLCFLPAMPAYSAGLIRSIWGCFIPCESTSHPGDPVAYLQVSYCSTNTLSAALLSKLTPLCQAKSGLSDAVAVRATAADVASCSSSSNTCHDEGLIPSGFTCTFVCPSEDNVYRKFTACAKTGDEAWQFARELCPDAVPSGDGTIALANTCTPEGQSPCE